MAGQTTWNKATVKAGSDPWNLVADTKKAIETAGLVFAVASETERSGLAALAPGGVLPVPTLIYRTDKARYETWNGSVWLSGFGKSYTPIWTGVADFGTGGSLTGTYWVDGDRVHVRSRARFGASATLGNSVVKCPLPTGYPISGTEPVVMGTGVYVPASGSIRPLTVFADAGAASVWIASDPIKTPGDVPVSAASGSYFEIAFSYQTSGV